METKEIYERMLEIMPTIHDSVKIVDLSESHGDYIATIEDSKGELCCRAIVYYSKEDRFDTIQVMSLLIQYPEIYGPDATNTKNLLEDL